jgi:hypothetical protein
MLPGFVYEIPIVELLFADYFRLHGDSFMKRYEFL